MVSSGIQKEISETHDVADEERPGGVPVEPVLVHGDVDVHYVAVLQRPAGRGQAQTQSLDIVGMQETH